MRCIYQSWVINKENVYSGTLLVTKKGVRGVYGVINPNKMTDYIFLDLSGAMQKIDIEKISIPIIENEAIYTVGYSSHEMYPYCLIKIEDGVIKKVPIPDPIQHEAINKISNISQFFVVGIEKNLYFINKKDLNITNVYSRFNFNSKILPYKEGVIVLDQETNAVVYCDKHHSEKLFNLPLGDTLDNWYSDDILLVDKFEGGSVLMNLKGEIMQQFDNSFFHILSYEPEKQATLSIMEPHKYGVFNFNFQFMDVLRTDRPQFHRPYIYDIGSQNIINLPDWAGYGIWINQNFDKDKFAKIQEEITSTE